MTMIDGSPLAHQLAQVDIANARWDSLLEESRGKTATDSDAKHSERMRKIDAAEKSYQSELVTLAALVRLAIERVEGKR